MRVTGAVLSECIETDGGSEGFDLSAWAKPAMFAGGIVIQLRSYLDSECSTIDQIIGTNNSAGGEGWFRKHLEIPAHPSAQSVRVRIFAENFYVDDITLRSKQILESGFEAMPCDTVADCPQSDDGCGTSACIEGVCDWSREPNGTSCNDFDGCSEFDRCVDGRCLGSYACAAIQNTLGSCEITNCVPIDFTEGSCSIQQLNSTYCDDGNECTLGEECLQGVCTPAVTLPDCVPGAAASGRAAPGVER